MDKLILFDNSKKYECNSFEEIVKKFFGDEYLNLSFNEKFKMRYEKAMGFCVRDNLELVDTRVGLLGSNGEVKSPEFDFDKAFIIDNEKTFILSMCKFEGVLMFEEKDCNIFYIPGVEAEVTKDNYIVINQIVDELLLLNLKI